MKSSKVPLVKAGRPVGSTSYYEKDLITDPEHEYGDIDVQFIIPRIHSMSEAANEAMYSKLVLEFLSHSNAASSKNGVNIIFQVGTEHVQIDLVSIFGENLAWSEILSPERGIKGVVSMSLYSSLAEVLNLSISSRGIQIDRKSVV